MCGIVGIAARSGALGEPLGLVIYRCLKSLEYRGYDSIGYAVVRVDGSLIVRKSRGKIDEVFERLGFAGVDGLVGIGHTRWATHGRPTDFNAHPHTDCGGRVAVVHNGIIENFAELRRWLSGRGHVFRSDTDTEVIPHLIEEFKRSGADSYTAFKRAVSILRGTYAIAAIDLDTPDRIYFARNTSPLVIGFGDGATFVSSDIPAFLNYTRRVLVLRDREVGYATASKVHVEVVEPGGLERLDPPGSEVVDYVSRVRLVEWTAEVASKGGYPHFMLKEIYEQPYALAQTLAGMADQVSEALNLLARAERLVLVGAGSSYHASLAGSIFFANLAELPSTAVVSSEALWHAKAWGKGDVVVAVSQSGETIDTLLAVREARRRGAVVVALSNVVDSTIPRESDLAVYTRAGPEIGVAATKTFTTQVISLLYMATATGVKRGVLPGRESDPILSDLMRISKLAGDVLSRSSETSKKLAEEVLAGSRSCYYLGRGAGLAVAMEGALKIKEVAYVHAEAYPAGESKHGPIALVERGFPTLFVALGNEDSELVSSNVEEMKAREALTIAVLPTGTRMRHLDYAIEVPRIHPYVLAALAVIPLQLVAYHTAITRGYDPDKPRNLAKTVTVV
jgi:glucosamine--fructose-6-phosphate aminotransferase (isomerizing)